MRSSVTDDSLNGCKWLRLVDERHGAQGLVGTSSRHNEGDVVIIKPGSAPGISGTRNIVRVHHLGGESRA
ncbi:hypothetical protein OHA61_11275 [Streptomyces sp. NBC_00885]|uniref:hypothetical protein n=1 Tax=Streptomyces sp. NBC_00885 TaxID=2975857 RepID=UPI0038707416|nr:hypothetical protein OHA61_11275 [Streptomyces sp. NBC_00885]